MIKSLDQIAREFYITNITGTATGMSLSQLQKTYWTQEVGSGSASTWTPLQQQWLRKIINDNGGTPNSKFTSDLLKQALASLSVGSSNFTDANWRLLFESL